MALSALLRNVLRACATRFNVCTL